MHKGHGHYELFLVNLHYGQVVMAGAKIMEKQERKMTLDFGCMTESYYERHRSWSCHSGHGLTTFESSKNTVDYSVCLVRPESSNIKLCKTSKKYDRYTINHTHNYSHLLLNINL